MKQKLKVFQAMVEGFYETRRTHGRMVVFDDGDVNDFKTKVVGLNNHLRIKDVRIAVFMPGYGLKQATREASITGVGFG